LCQQINFGSPNFICGINARVIAGLIKQLGGHPPAEAGHKKLPIITAEWGIHFIKNV